jgi:hypothetical protein
MVLRGLTVINQGSTGSGIVFSSSFGTLHVEDCVVTGFSAGRPSSAGLAFVGGGRLEVADFGILVPSPAVLLSRGDNTVEGNATDISGTVGTYSAK